MRSVLIKLADNMLCFARDALVVIERKRNANGFAIFCILCYIIAMRFQPGKKL